MGVVLVVVVAAADVDDAAGGAAGGAVGEFSLDMFTARSATPTVATAPRVTNGPDTFMFTPSVLRRKLVD